MEDRRGWLGEPGQLLHVLGSFGAERDEDGKFLVAEDRPSSFMGMGQEIVVSARMTCRINGKWVPVIGLLYATSYGSKVTEI